MRDGSGEDGFTLAELMVSVGIISSVLAAVTHFFVTSMTVTHQGADTQSGSQVVTAALDYAQRVGPVELKKWQTPADEQTDTAAASPDKNNEPPFAVGGVDYRRAWDIDDCHLTSGFGADMPSPDNCTHGLAVVSTGEVPLVRVTVRVTWPCRKGTCFNESATLLSAAATEPALTP